MMHAWEFIGSELFDLALPEYTSLLKEETAHTSIDVYPIYHSVFLVQLEYD
jgi:hypothetical protein